MKALPNIILATLALTCLPAMAGTFQSASVTNVISLALTAKLQNTVSDDGTNTSAGAPMNKSVKTADILSELAKAANTAGHYPSDTFPSGAQLAVVIGHETSPVFLVLDSAKNPILDVSDILSVENGHYDFDVFSGKQNNTTGLAIPSSTDLHVMTFIYDDTAILGEGGLKFYLGGVMTSKTTDKINSGGTTYTETMSNKMKGAGEGSYQGTPLVVTGTMSTKGSGISSL
jgi:hypothetical protein